MNKNNLELRMYMFVPYQLNGIQSGIQAGHAALEYAYKYGNTDLYKDFIENHKTWIILNGGTTMDPHPDSPDIMGTMNELEQKLQDLSIVNYATFREPDLNNSLTAICLICDERVFNQKDYPNFKEFLMKKQLNVSYNSRLKELNPEYYKWWVDSLGGETNEKLREIISSHKLA